MAPSSTGCEPESRNVSWGALGATAGYLSWQTTRSQQRFGEVPERDLRVAERIRAVPGRFGRGRGMRNMLPFNGTYGTRVGVMPPGWLGRQD